MAPQLTQLSPPLRTGSGASGLVYRSSSEVAAQLAALRDMPQELPRTPKSPVRVRPFGPVARHTAATRRRRRSMLSRLLAAALLVVALSGTTSYRMHLAEHAGEDWDSEPDGGWDSEGGGAATRLGPLSGLRSWLAGARSAGRRSLREGPPGLSSLSLATPRAVQRAAGSADPGATAAGAHQFERWWFIDGYAQLEQQQQQQQGAVGYGSSGEGGQGAEDGPLQRMLALRRLQPSAFKLYDFKEKNWQQHNVTRIPVEVPVARWAVASLLNRAKKKESIIFLAGGYASPKEVASGRPPRPPKTDAGAVSLRSTGGAGVAAGPADACPLASPAVYAVNTGRSRFRALPQLPEPRYGGAAAVAGARLHVLGGWATPDRGGRQATPAATHWSIGLNADGSSAPEWDEELALPAELVGRSLTVLPLSLEEEGEPGLFVWTDGSVDGAAAAGDEAACYADPALAQQPSSGGAVAFQLWSYTASAGWQKRGPLPQPLADDLQCAVAASPYELLAVGSVERSGLLTRQRGVWQFDARRGGRWSRAGWAPVHFQGRLCALHHSRLFISGGLPAEAAPQQAGELGSADAEELAAAAESGGGVVASDATAVAAAAAAAAAAAEQAVAENGVAAEAAVLDAAATAANADLQQLAAAVGAVAEAAAQETATAAAAAAAVVAAAAAGTASTIGQAGAVA